MGQPRSPPFPTREGGENTQERRSAGRARPSRGSASERRTSLLLMVQGVPEGEEAAGLRPCPNERRGRPAPACSKETGMLATTAKAKTYVLMEENSGWRGLSILSPSSLVYLSKNCTTFPRCLIVHYQRSGASKRKFKSDFPRRERSEVLRPSRSPSFLSIHLGHEDRNEATPDRFRRCAPRRGRWGGVV